MSIIFFVLLFLSFIFFLIFFTLIFRKKKIMKEFSHEKVHKTIVNYYNDKYENLNDSLDFSSKDNISDKDLFFTKKNSFSEKENEAYSEINKKNLNFVISQLNKRKGGKL